jgi:hypothetical protein
MSGSTDRLEHRIRATEAKLRCTAVVDLFSFISKKRPDLLSHVAQIVWIYVWINKGCDDVMCCLSLFLLVVLMNKMCYVKCDGCDGFYCPDSNFRSARPDEWLMSCAGFIAKASSKIDCVITPVTLSIKAVCGNKIRKKEAKKFFVDICFKSIP